MADPKKSSGDGSTKLLGIIIAVVVVVLTIIFVTARAKRYGVSTGSTVKVQTSSTREVTVTKEWSPVIEVNYKVEQVQKTIYASWKAGYEHVAWQVMYNGTIMDTIPSLSQQQRMKLEGKEWKPKYYENLIEFAQFRVHPESRYESTVIKYTIATKAK